MTRQDGIAVYGSEQDGRRSMAALDGNDVRDDTPPLSRFGSDFSQGGKNHKRKLSMDGPGEDFGNNLQARNTYPKYLTHTSTDCDESAKDRAKSSTDTARGQEEEEEKGYGIFTMFQPFFRFMRRPKKRGRLFRVVTSKEFDMVIGFIILTNTFVIGFEQTVDVEEQGELRFVLFEQIFLVIYLVELALRWYVFGVKCLADNWVKFDHVLVATGVLTEWVLRPLNKGQTKGGALDQSYLAILLRTMRLARLARTVRLLVKFRVLWMLVRSLVGSASTMLYTLILIFMILYVFACIGFECITNNRMALDVGDPDPEFQDIVEKYFKSMPMIMLTLVQFVCLDSVGVIYKPLIEKDWLLAPYFIAIILVVPVVLMNIVTAVIVNSAFEQAMQDKEALKVDEQRRKRRVIKEVRKLFHRLDEDGSGMVSRDEIECASDQDLHELAHCMAMSDPLEIFSALDVDGSGCVDIDEFCEAIWRTAISQSPPEIQRMEKQVSQIYAQMREVYVQATKFNARTHELLEEIRGAMSQNTAFDGAESRYSDMVLKDAYPEKPNDKLQPGRAAEEWAAQLAADIQRVASRSQARRQPNGFGLTESDGRAVSAIVGLEDVAHERPTHEKLKMEEDDAHFVWEPPPSSLNVSGFFKSWANTHRSEVRAEHELPPEAPRSQEEQASSGHFALADGDLASMAPRGRGHNSRGSTTASTRSGRHPKEASPRVSQHLGDVSPPTLCVMTSTAPEVGKSGITLAPPRRLRFDMDEDPKDPPPPPEQCTRGASRPSRRTPGEEGLRPEPSSHPVWV